MFPKFHQLAIVCLVIFSVFPTFSLASHRSNDDEDVDQYGRQKFVPVYNRLAKLSPLKNNSNVIVKAVDYQFDERFFVNCSEPGINDFPEGIFTQEQRQNGWVTVHFIVCAYLMLLIGNVVDEYFVPSLEVIAETLKMRPDVAGATIMAVGTSSPELFINLVGTFVTQGDVGVGMIVGSAVFNILAVPAVAGLFTGFAVALDWWPLTRDCIIYGAVVIGLAVVLSDGKIYWWEAMIFVLSFSLYVIVMLFNKTLERWANNLLTKIRSCTQKSLPEYVAGEPISGIRLDSYKETKENKIELPAIERCDSPGPDELPNLAVAGKDDEPDGPVQLFKRPEGSLAGKIYWYAMWPGNALLLCSIPDVRRKGWRWTYPIAFFMCMLWIGSLSYLVTWIITVIGYTLGIPDSAMGITFLAAGGSVPEAVAVVVVARAGKGSMGISNSVGSNTFDILICMGLPWLIKAAAFPLYPEEGNFVGLNSAGVVYSVLMLFCTILILYFSIALNKFVLDKKIGALLLVSYAAFLVLASCFELNVFMEVNPPTCTTA